MLRSCLRYLGEICHLSCRAGATIEVLREIQGNLLSALDTRGLKVLWEN